MQAILGRRGFCFLTFVFFWARPTLALPMDAWVDWKLDGTARGIARVLRSDRLLTPDQRQILEKLRLLEEPLPKCEVASLKGLGHRKNLELIEGRIIRSLLMAPYGVIQAAHKVFYAQKPLRLDDFHDFGDEEPISVNSVGLSFLRPGFLRFSTFAADMNAIDVYQHFFFVLRSRQRRHEATSSVSHVFFERLTFNARKNTVDLVATLRFDDRPDVRVLLENIAMPESAELSPFAAELLVTEVLRPRPLILEVHEPVETRESTDSPPAVPTALEVEAPVEPEAPAEPTNILKFELGKSDKS